MRQPNTRSSTSLDFSRGSACIYVAVLPFACFGSTSKITSCHDRLCQGQLDGALVWIRNVQWGEEPFPFVLSLPLSLFLSFVPSLAELVKLNFIGGAMFPGKSNVLFDNARYNDTTLVYTLRIPFATQGSMTKQHGDSVVASSEHASWAPHVWLIVAIVAQFLPAMFLIFRPDWTFTSRTMESRPLFLTRRTMPRSICRRAPILNICSKFRCQCKAAITECWRQQFAGD
jgi:hypothetical protein